LTNEIVLASASPRRALLLRALGIPFRVVVSEVDERVFDGEVPAVAAERLAQEKARAVAARERAAPVLAADTLVVLQQQLLGKPGSNEQAAEMLRSLRGRTHEVLTGVCVIHGDLLLSGVERTQVSLAEMSDEEVAWYVATGEPLDKAGAYHVDGRGALFVEAVHGSPSNVAGLPVRLVLRLLREAGLGFGGGPDTEDRRRPG
jgi:septum formation protein